MVSTLIPIVYMRNGAGEMFADIKLSVDELEPLLAQFISERLKTPITAEDILKVEHHSDDDGEFTGLTVEVELPPVEQSSEDDWNKEEELKPLDLRYTNPPDESSSDA